MLVAQNNPQQAYRKGSPGEADLISMSPALVATIEKYENAVLHSPATIKTTRLRNQNRLGADGARASGPKSMKKIDFSRGKDFLQTWDADEMLLGKEAVEFWERHKWDNYTLPLRPDLRSMEDVANDPEFDEAIDAICALVDSWPCKPAKPDSSLAAFLPSRLRRTATPDAGNNSDSTSSGVEHSEIDGSGDRVVAEDTKTVRWGGEIDSDMCEGDCALGDLPQDKWRNPSPPEPTQAGMLICLVHAS